MNRKRLYRCRYDRQLSGVAGGIAEYLDVDPTVVRLLWIVSIFFGGFTILLYILMAFIVPLEPAGYGLLPAAPPGAGISGPDASASSGGPGSEGGSTNEGGGDPAAAAGGLAGSVPSMDPHASSWAGHAGEVQEPHRHAGSPIGGSLLTTLGVLLLVFGGIALVGPSVPGWVSGLHLGPAFLLALGVALLVASIRRAAPDR